MGYYRKARISDEFFNLPEWKTTWDYMNDDEVKDAAKHFLNVNPWHKECFDEQSLAADFIHRR